MTRPKYRVYVWKTRWRFRDQPWFMSVWADGESVVFHPDAPVRFPTHAEAVTAGLKWANELNTREQEEA